MMIYHDRIVKERIIQIQDKINAACKRSNRTPREITLIGVTKGRSPNQINQIIKFGLNNLGENRIQEFLKKKTEIKDENKLIHHFIGHLQTNKIKKAIDNFHFIHTIDSFKKIQKTNTIAKNIQKTVKFFLQINIGNDPQKNGFTKKRFLDILDKIQEFKFIQLVGVMTITPLTKNKQQIRQYYNETKKMQERAQTIINTCVYISMGMTNDYEIAIEEGATHLRIGRGLFDD